MQEGTANVNPCAQCDGKGEYTLVCEIQGEGIVPCAWCSGTGHGRDRLVDAANVALAHIEGRRGTFSTRDPRTVAIILRQALGEHVNENRGAADMGVSDA